MNLSLSKLFHGFLKISDRLFNLGDLLALLVRVKVDYSAAGAGMLTVMLYISDAFLDVATTVIAGNSDSLFVQKIHEVPYVEL